MRNVLWVGLCVCLVGCSDEPEGNTSDVSDAVVGTDSAVDMGTEDTAALDTRVGDTTGQPDTGTGLEWPVEDGRWGAPETTFTLPETAEGEGLYVPDVQERFPEVDWATVDRLYIPAGAYKFIRLGNLPDREASNPLIITNLGGQVRVGNYDHHYLFVLGGGSHWVLTGRYDPVSQTGDAGFPGHRGGAFESSAGTYGLLVDDAFIRDGNSGLAVGGGATAFELEYLEITRVEFAGMLIKTDNDAAATMEDVSLHDVYIHDTGSEGLYIGSTQGQPQHQIRDWEIYNNRILRTGTEAIQMGQLGGTNKVHHNVFGPAAIDWRASFQNFQDNNFQIGMREGALDVHHNLFLGSAGSMLSFFRAEVSGDATDANSGLHFHDNYLDGMRNLGMYANNVSLPGMTHRFENNTFRGFRFERDEVYADSTPYGYLLRIINDGTPFELVDNRWEGDVDLANRIADGNSTDGNLSGSGNVKGATEAVSFVNAGLEENFDMLRLEMWTDVAERGSNQPVTYPQNMLVMHDGEAYRCLLDPCPAGALPPESPGTWEALGALPDDVRILPGSAYEGYGLTPSP